MKQKPALQTTGHRRRIKEKFKLQGLAAFHDYEVLEMLLSYCIARKDVKPVAKNLLQNFKSFQGVLDAPLEQLQKVDEIGEHSALLIKLIRTCCDYYLSAAIAQRDVIASPQALIKY
jgi:DNA repair protein RadC